MGRYDSNTKFDFLNAMVDCTGLIKGALTTDEKAILITVWSYLNEVTRECYLKRKNLIRLSGFTSDSQRFRNAYQSIQDKNWLIVKKQYDNNNIYTLQIPNDILEILNSHDCRKEDYIEDRTNLDASKVDSIKKMQNGKKASVDSKHKGIVDNRQYGTVEQRHELLSTDDNLKENIKEKEKENIKRKLLTKTIENKNEEEYILSQKEKLGDIFNTDEEESENEIY